MSPSAGLVERIDAVVTAAAHRLFESHGVSLREATSETAHPREDHDLAASIGFASALAHGALVMTTSRQMVGRTYPRGLRADSPSDRQVCDWTGELANQLLGRIKNAFVSLGLVLDQGTPTVVTGKHLHRTPASTTIARRFAFTSEGATVIVYFDAAFSAGFKWRESAESPEAVAEGDIRLF